MARLIDSSLWIDFTRAKSPLALKEFVLPWLSEPSSHLCEPVAFEVLRHANPTERKRLMSFFSTFPMLPTPAILWKESTDLGQRCRMNGFTAGSLDLLIAALAIHHDSELITFDSDFLSIAAASELRVQVLTRSWK